MRAVIQRVSRASVTVAGEITGQIGPGLLVLLGIHAGDTAADAHWLAEKISALRIFEDVDGKMNLSVKEFTAATAVDFPAPAAGVPRVLVVSQFTLIASTRKGARPSFHDAARPEVAIPLYDSFLRYAEAAVGRPVATGRFGALMEVSLVNHGPVTLLIDSQLRE
jgi:D-tyrosyl-tRNA(Tyr) deacylase